MKKLSAAIIISLAPVIFLFLKCSENKSNGDGNKKDTSVVSNAATGGFESQVKWG